MSIVLYMPVAALSVLGLYFLFKVIFSLVFTNDTAAAVIIEDFSRLKDLDLLLEDAKGAFFTSRNRTIAVLLTENVISECDEGDLCLARNTADAFGAEIYVI